MDKKILITGGNGMLAFALKQVLETHGHTVVTTDVDDLDITKAEQIENTLIEQSPDVLINCAAYTNVNEAEDNKELANLINGTAVGYLAKSCLNHHVQFFHISTDYVFGENKEGGYSEDDIPNNPLNFYGSSKLLGEQEAIQQNKNAYIVRTSWIYGPNGKNFVDTMIDLGTREELSIVSDEIGSPTYTFDVAESIATLINEDYKPGIYHAVNDGSCSRFEEAQAVFEFLNNPIKLNKILLKDYPRKAQVPHISVLQNNKLPKLRHWKEALQSYLSTKS